jgi:hypothetical protein
MALITEDGTVVAGAESYITVAAADTYHSNRGNTNWAALTTLNKEIDLRKATDYMVQMYRAKWQGYRHSATQTLDWPRDYVYLEPFIVGAVGAYPYLVANNIVPVEVQRACAELALKSSTAELLADLTQQKASVTVGPISTTYDSSSPQFKRYTAIDAMLSPYFGNDAGKAVRV